MADNAGPIASAVVLPEVEPPKSPPTKRRQSSASDSTSKRPRVSLDPSSHSPTAIHDSPKAIKAEEDALPEKAQAGDPNRGRRKSSVVEERKRGQRLFGGLLSTLSQSTPNGQQKRRLEIEKRQQEKAKQQKAADEVRRAEKLANLKAVRKEEQIKFDEESMRIRHSNMLAMAQFLSTKAEPKLYYKPWELLPRDEDRIRKQIVDAEALIEREVDEFYTRHPKENGRDSSAESKTNGASKETVGEPQLESPSVSNVDTTNLSPVQAPQSEKVKAEKQAQEEHNGEVVLENEEDTVIY
ncbi:pinin/SDK/memA/ protein conserved region-domain-containing protein [Hyaloscypha sp. PMI_1271]|nr:pinin/SDK/memA/ protein conserved region-domain-containing protein [Hyaloscypha sp. PMI_1271]